MSQRYLCRKQAATYAGMSESTINRLVKAGKLPVSRPTGPNGRTVYDRDDIDAYLASQKSVAVKAATAATA